METDCFPGRKNTKKSSNPIGFYPTFVDMKPTSTQPIIPTTDPRKGLTVLCTAAFLVPFMGSALNLALPEIATELSMKAVTMTWMATAYLISTAIFQIPFARLADLIGRKKIFIGGICIFTLGTFLCGLAPSASVLIAMRFLSGIGSAMMFGTNIAILTAIFPPERRGQALGINVAVVYGALAVGPFSGGILTHYLGWHSLFFVCAGIGLLVLIFARLFLKGEWIEARGQRFDLRGSLLYGLGLAGLIYGFSELPNLDGLICLPVGLAILIGFWFYEKHLDSPVLNVGLFTGNRVFTLSTLATLINYAATFAIVFMLSLYLQYIRGLDARHAGLILIAQACVQSIFSLISGPLSDRISPSKLATSGMLIIVAGIAGLIFIDEHTSLGLIVLLLMLLGMGFGIFSSPNTNVIMSSVNAKAYSQASATMGTMRLTGQAFSMGIAGMAISLQLGDAAITPAQYPQFMESLRITFLIFELLCLIGVYASSVRTTSAQNGPTPD